MAREEQSGIISHLISRVFFDSMLQVLFTERTDGSTRLPEKARAIVEAAVSTSLSHPNVVSCHDVRLVCSLVNGKSRKFTRDCCEQQHNHFEQTRWRL